MIEALFAEVEAMLCEVHGAELVGLFREEMNRSFTAGFFEDRKAEFLRKIGKDSKEYVYWDVTF